MAKESNGVQKRLDRQPRWTLKPGDQLYPRHYANYETCLSVAQEMTYYVYCMPGAPVCPDEIIMYLGRIPKEGEYLCPICLLPIMFADFEVVCRNFCNLDCPVSHPFNLRP
jgi:hypothetical protein